MTTDRRVNVNSGRQLEQLAHYSRALRVGDTVLQSGTTAIDVEGNVIGVGDVGKQVDAILEIAAASMGEVEGRLEDVVRSRVYVTDIGLADAAGRALGRHFRDARPATTLVAVNRLARPAQLIEIELDAVDGAKDRAKRAPPLDPEEEAYGFSRAVRIDDRVLIAGAAGGPPGNGIEAQVRHSWTDIEAALESLGARLNDVVYTKTFLTDLDDSDRQTDARLAALGEVRPVETLIGVPGLRRPNARVEVEAEAIVGAATTRRNIYTEQRREHARGYARAVEVGDRVYVSGCTATDAAGAVQSLGDWATQYDLCHRNIQWALEQAGAKLDDVVRRRIFTVVDAEQNRPHGEGPGWFADSRPVSLGCRIAGLAHADMLVEVDAVAIKGAHRNIKWRRLAVG